MSRVAHGVQHYPEPELLPESLAEQQVIELWNPYAPDDPDYPDHSFVVNRLAPEIPRVHFALPRRFVPATKPQPGVSLAAAVDMNWLCEPWSWSACRAAWW